MRRILAAAAVIAIFLAGALWATGKFWPGGGSGSRPKLAELPPLKPAARTSVVVAPVAVALAAIRPVLEAAAPRDLSDKASNPMSGLLSKADIGVNVSRGPIAIAGRPEGLIASVPLHGTFRITGQLGTQAGKLTGTLGSLLNPSLGRDVEALTGRFLDQGVEARGTVVITSRPAITADWRVDPNLSAQVNIDEGALNVAGLKLNVANEVKPMLDKSVAEQMAALEARLQNEPFVEKAARHAWAKICRSIPLGGAAAGLPDLWLELRPTRAFTAQPRIDASNITFTAGMQAETRITGRASKPSCPFPARLEIMPKVEAGRVAVAVPIDLPFTEVSKLLEAQIKTRRFPEDGSGPIQVEVLRASVGASGDSLLLSLRVKAYESRSWFGFGAEADLHVWGVPVLDHDKQILKFTDVALAVESEAAFGLLGTAVQAARPYLRKAIEENAILDLKPFAANARQKIGAAIAETGEDSDDVRIDAAVSDVRLLGIEFDSKTLRVIAEAGGNVRVTVTKLSGM
jgi:hypothetical protein